MEIVFLVILVAIVGGLLYGCIKLFLHLYYSNKPMIVKIIRMVSIIMLVGGVILFFACLFQADDAERSARWSRYSGYQHLLDAQMWKSLSVQSITTAVSSIFVWGFSYIVEAACLYIEKQEQEEENKADE